MVDLVAASRRRSSAAASCRKSSSFRWCCSFAVPPSSPDVRSSFSNPTKPPQKSSYNGVGSFHSSPSPSSKLGLGIIDPRRILSPGRVSPIDSDPPLAPLPEIENPVRSSIAAVESVAEVSDPPAEEREVQVARGEDGCLDLRVRLKGRDGRLLVLELDSRVLCESSLFFKGTG